MREYYISDKVFAEEREPGDITIFYKATENTSVGLPQGITPEEFERIASFMESMETLNELPLP